jgi:hypothetical protein
MLGWSGKALALCAGIATTSADRNRQADTGRVAIPIGARGVTAGSAATTTAVGFNLTGGAMTAGSGAALDSPKSSPPKRPGPPAVAGRASEFATGPGDGVAAFGTIAAAAPERRAPTASRCTGALKTLAGADGTTGGMRPALR